MSIEEIRAFYPRPHLNETGVVAAAVQAGRAGAVAELAVGSLLTPVLS